MAKILIIEDADDVRENLVELLEAEEHQVMAGHNGLVGLEMARKHQPDLILCDVLMPEMDGHGVLAALREDSRTANTPFIFLTARAEKDDIRSGMVMGADDYLTKPYTRAEVLDAIASRLNRQASTADMFEKKMETLRQNMARMLPHELRTPLASILGYSSLLMETFESLEADEVKEMLRSIHHDGERLHRLIQKYLWYVDVELTRHDPERLDYLRRDSTPAAKRVLSKIACRIADEFQRRNDLRLAVDVQKMCMGELYLVRMCEELIENAFKFSTPGTPVCIEARTERDGRVNLSIRDQGRGMTPEQIAEVGAYLQFDREQYEQQGVGMGLATARGIAEIHGGALTIQSEPDRFTTVQIVLPSGCPCREMSS